MKLGDFIQSRLRYPGCELIRVSGRNDDFSTETHQVSLSGQSFGDALRMGAIIKDRCDPGKEQIVFVEHDWPFGVEVIQNLSFVDWIVKFPRESWSKVGHDLDFLEGPKFSDLDTDYKRLTEGYLGVSPDGVALDYDLSDFTGRFDLPELPYIAFQPFSTWNKIMKVSDALPYVEAMKQRGHAVCLIGGAGDPAGDSFGAYFNAIGRLSVPHSIWLAANAVGCVGVESWCATLVAMMGNPSLMACLPSSLDLYGERWREAWPHITLVSYLDTRLIARCIGAMRDYLSSVCAACLAVASPMPLLPPVMTAVFPCKASMI